MNQRIKELEKQCWNHQTWQLDVEKFAELIVKKVFDSIAAEGFEVYEPVVQKVKQSFGVEE